MLMGWLAISGIPIWAGFFSKDEILWRTWSAPAGGFPASAAHILWAVGALTALLTAIYMTRLMVMTFGGKERFRDAHADVLASEGHAEALHKVQPVYDARSASGNLHADHADDESLTDTLEDDEEEEHHHGPVKPHESPWVMTVPLIVLAILSTFGGLLGVPYALSSLVGLHVDNYFEKTIEPAIARPPGGVAVAAGAETTTSEPEYLSQPPQPTDGAPALSVGKGEASGMATAEAHSAEEVSMERLFTGISVIIALLGISIGWGVFKKRPLLEMPRILENKYYVDEIYDAAIINPIKVISREGLWKLFDLGVIDGIVNGLGRGVSEIGSLARYIQIGFVRSYAAFILLGALAVIGYFVVKFIPFAR
jgi:NADH-quinone oxidoreductase subunit L